VELLAKLEKSLYRKRLTGIIKARAFIRIYKTYKEIVTKGICKMKLHFLR